MKNILRTLFSCVGILLFFTGATQSSLEFTLLDSRFSDNSRAAEENALCGEGIQIPTLLPGESADFIIEIQNNGSEVILFSDKIYFSVESNPNFTIISTPSKNTLQINSTAHVTIRYSYKSYAPFSKAELVFIQGDGSQCSIFLQLLEKVAFLDVTKIDRLDGANVFRGGSIPFELKIKNIGDGDLNNLEVETPVGDYLFIESGSVRTSPLAIDDEYMGMMRGLNVDAVSGVKANDFDDDLPGTTILESGSPLPTAEGGSVTLQDDGSFVYTPPGSPPASGMDMFIYTLVDGNPLPGVVDNNDAKVTLLLNSAPIADAQMVMVLEDEIPAPNITLTGSDPDMDMITFMVVDNPTKGMLSGTPPNLTYTPNTNEYGSDNFTFKVNDGLVDSPLATVTIDLKPVNDEPSFTKGADEMVNEDAGAQTVNMWATAISPGPANESGQMVSFNVTNDNNALFAIQPAVNASGNLTYTPADDANGSATITIEAMDDGGTDNSGDNTSSSQMFTITVNPVNDPPTITCGPIQVILNSDGAQTVVNWATGISVGPANEAAQNPPTITVTNNNNALFNVQPAVATNGTLTYTPAGGSTGFANVSVTISDGVVMDDVSCMFTITVQEAPMAQNDAFQTKLNTDITGQSLFADNGSGADDLGFPSATITSFGGGSLGGVVTDNVGGATVALAGGTLQVNANGSFTLTGQPFAIGIYTFDYRITNTAGTSDATVTINITPLEDPAVCNADSYNGTGNIAIDISAAIGVLDNDGGTNLVVEAVEGSVANVGVATAATNGTVTCNADGSFTFEPAAGATIGSFQYTVDNSLNMPQTCTATITFSDMIWFIDVAGTGTNAGTFLNPFKTIAAFNASAGPAAGHYISLNTGSYTELDGINLKNNQILLGKGIALSTYFTAHVNSISAYSMFAGTAGTRPTIGTTGGAGNNGIDLASGNIIRGLNIANRSGAIAIKDNGGTAGNLTISDMNIIGLGGGIEVNNGGILNVTIDALTANSNTDEGIHLDGTTGTFNVTGNTNITTTGVTGLLANNGGTINLQGAASTISSINSTAVNISNTTIGSSDVTFQSVSVDGQNTLNSPGIVLLNTGISGNFSITGTGGTSGSGGTIQRILTDGINITSSFNVTLSNLNVTNCGNAVNEHGIEMTEVTGFIDFNNLDVAFSSEKNVEIEMTSGSVVFTADDCTFRDTQSSGTGADGLELGIRGSAMATIDINSSSFLKNSTNGIQVIVEGTAQVTKCDITNSTFDPGTDSGIGINLATNNTADLKFNVMNNPKIYSDGGNTVNVIAFVNSTIEGRINNNADIQTDRTAGTPSGGSGIRVVSEEQANVKVEISGNTITNIFQDNGIQLVSRASTTGTAGRLDATVNSNAVTLQGAPAFPLYGIEVRAQEDNTTCANIAGNTVSLGSGVAVFRERTAAGGSTVELQGFTVDVPTTWSGKGNSPPGPFSISNNGTVSGGTCATVLHPLP